MIRSAWPRRADWNARLSARDRRAAFRPRRRRDRDTGHLHRVPACLTDGTSNGPDFAGDSPPTPPVCKARGRRPLAHRPGLLHRRPERSLERASGATTPGQGPAPPTASAPATAATARRRRARRSPSRATSRRGQRTSRAARRSPERAASGRRRTWRRGSPSRRGRFLRVLEGLASRCSRRAAPRAVPRAELSQPDTSLSVSTIADSGPASATGRTHRRRTSARAAPCSTPASELPRTRSPRSSAPRSRAGSSGTPPSTVDAENATIIRPSTARARGSSTPASWSGRRRHEAPDRAGRHCSASPQTSPGAVDDGPHDDRSDRARSVPCRPGRGV